MHLCVGGCCDSRAEAESKVTWAILRVLLRTLPVTPLLSDWVRLGPNLDFFIAAEHQGLLTKLLLSAQWAMQLPTQDVSGETVCIEWRALAGSRFQRTCKMLVSYEERFERTLLAIAIEPLRHLHSAFLKCAHTAPDDQSWPTLLQQIWAPSSKFVAVLQYYSSLLTGACGRMRLLFQLDGHTSMSQCVAECPEEARQARNLILLIAGSVHKRFLATLDRFPFKLFGLADARRRDGEALVKEFYSKPLCCHPAGFARELRKHVSKDDFMQHLSQFRWFALMTSFITKLTIASVERRHATHQQQANRGMPFSMFAAGSVLAECRHQDSAVERMKLERLRIQREKDQMQRGLDGPVSLPADKPSKVRSRKQRTGGWVVRAQSAEEIYRWDWLKREKTLGRSWKPASKECWKASRAAFSDLTAEEKAVLEERSKASKLEAAVNRKVLKRLKKCQDRTCSTTEHQVCGESQPAASTQGQTEEADPLALMIQQPATLEDASQRQPPMPKQVSCQSLLSPLQVQAQSGDSAAGRSKQKFPIKPEAILIRSKAPGGVRKGVDDFTQQATTIAGGDAMPNQVLYPGCCGALCRNQSTQRALYLHGKIVDSLLKVVEGSNLKPGHVSRGSILFAAEQYQDTALDIPSRTSFYAIAHASGRQAHHKPQVTLAELESLFCPHDPPQAESY